MAGVTATISVVAFRGDWASHMPIAALCERYTITKDQVLRLRDVWHLPLRHDRRLRFKPRGMEKPTPEEIAASESSLSLAPLVAARATTVSSFWTEEIRAARQVSKPIGFRLACIDTPEELRGLVEEEP